MSLPSVIAGPASDAHTATMPKATFLDLPTELRCVAYKQYLVGNCRIELHRPERRSLDDRKLKMKGRCRPNIETAIIFASKVIHSEAIAILYGANSFSLETILDFQTFLFSINKDSVQHLRRIGYQDFGNKDIVRSSLLSLQVAKSLTRLEISNEMTGESGWLKGLSAKEIVKMLSPLFEILQKRRKAYREDKVGPISDIISIHAARDGFVYERRNQEARLQAEAKATAVEIEVKALLELKFG